MRLPSMWRMTPGSTISVAKYASDPTTRSRLDGRRDHAAGIDALEPQPVQLAADPLEIPPRDAVLRADDDGVGPEERRERRREAGQAVRLDAEEDDVGRADRREIAGRRRGRTSKSPSGLIDAQAALLHRLQMRAAREQHDVRARLREPRADVAADRAGAGDDDLHDASLANACATTRR